MKETFANVVLAPNYYCCLSGNRVSWI